MSYQLDQINKIIQSFIIVFMHKFKSLYNLLAPWVLFCPISINITGLELDSRKIIWGNLFIAIKGNQIDGRLYIGHAIKEGAVAVLSESLNNQITMIVKKYDVNISGIPIIYIRHLNKYLSDIAARFYNYPSYFLDLVGVTGTNGKTTVTCLLANWMQLLGKKSAVMGTLGNGMLDNMCPSYNTTCSAVDNQKILAQFVQHKITFVAMEVSSHGLDQHRVDALYFKAAVFTNLSRDHLDYHGTIKKYVLTKWRLFNKLHVENYIINADDFIGRQWLSCLSQAVAVTIMGVLPYHWKGKWIRMINVNYHFYGTDVFFDSSWGKGIIYSALLGEFNIINLLLALGTLLVLGYPLSLLLHTSSQLRPICGRMETFKSFGRYPMVVIDYAHTPDALKKVLISIKKYCFGKLWCIFGCGGERDQGKRSLMGTIAEKYSDHVIITNDNPRTEDPQIIVDDIMCGITCVKKVEIIENRSYAIRTVIMRAFSKDVVLISGKGHEKYQIIGTDYIPYSDRDVVKSILKD